MIKLFFIIVIITGLLKEQLQKEGTLRNQGNTCTQTTSSENEKVGYKRIFASQRT